MNEAVIALSAALGAALLTGAGSLGVVWYQERLRGKASDADALAATITGLLTASFALAVRARTIGETAKVRSGVTEGLDVATRQRRPVDLMELHDWLERDWGPLRAAWSELWARGDQELIASGNRLMGACAEMISAATDLAPPSPDLTSKVKRVFQGEKWTPEMTERLRAAELSLARARKDLAVLARGKLGRTAVDPFAGSEPVTEET